MCLAGDQHEAPIRLVAPDLRCNVGSRAFKPFMMPRTAVLISQTVAIRRRMASAE